MLMIADVLARGIAAHKHLPTAELDAPRRQLQSALSHLLAEHMGLMVQTMRASVDRAPDLAAAERALDTNTKALAGAINALYGAKAGQQFLGIWADHVDGLVHYASVAKTQDAAAKQAETKKEVAAYSPVLARFLSSATGGRVPSVELAGALTEHDQDLRAQVDAYAAKDKAKAQQTATHGYDHMFELAQSLATAVGDTIARKLPTGGAQTGGGGTAGRER
jgi:alpha-D-ribose 1-methylphosphonate 5-triphosphate synthase subunit PhnI